MHEDEVLQRLALKIALVNATPDLSSALLLDVWKQVGPQGAAARDILAAKQGMPAAVLIQSLLLLAKLGLVKIVDPA